jgi:outer membrane protein assembly factor BamB
MKKMYKLFYGIAGMLLLLSASAFAGDIESIFLWKFNCGAIYAKPLIHDSIIYFSTDDKKFYAVNINKAEEIWHYEADKGNSFPAIKDSIIVFEASNKLYALHALTGKLFWKFTTDSNAVFSIGSTDYHHSSPVIADSLVIFCDQSGYINGIDLKSGKLIYQYLTDGHNALRGTPAIKDSLVFIGDWLGNIYAVSLKDSIQLWKHVMQNVRSNYGAVVSEMVIKDDVLYFGSQHDVFSPLDISTGEPVWTYVDPRATYLPPTPVFYENNFIIGTTIFANQIMCFSNDTVHKQIWNFQANGIFFTTPVIKDSLLIMNSCNFDFKTGFMYLLNCKDGKQIKQLQFNNTGPYIPVLDDTILFIGTGDGLYAANLNAILSGKGSNIVVSSDSLEGEFKINTGLKKLDLNIHNEGNVCDSVEMTIESLDSNFESYFTLKLSKKLVGVINNPSYLMISTNDLQTGEYYMTVNVHPFDNPDTTMKINIKVTIYQPNTAVESIESASYIELFPNPARESVIFRFNEMFQTNMGIRIYTITGKLIASKSFVVLNDKYEYSWNLLIDDGKKIPKGEYICQIISNKEVHCKKLIVN